MTADRLKELLPSFVESVIYEAWRAIGRAEPSILVVTLDPQAPEDDPGGNATVIATVLNPSVLKECVTSARLTRQKHQPDFTIIALDCAKARFTDQITAADRAALTASEPHESARLVERLRQEHKLEAPQTSYLFIGQAEGGVTVFAMQPYRRHGKTIRLTGPLRLELPPGIDQEALMKQLASLDPWVETTALDEQALGETCHETINANALLTDRLDVKDLFPVNIGA